MHKNTPDLAAFGKALGNGMPISAVVGRADLMDEMEEVFSRQLLVVKLFLLQRQSR